MRCFPISPGHSSSLQVINVQAVGLSAAETAISSSQVASCYTRKNSYDVQKILSVSCRQRFGLENEMAAWEKDRPEIIFIRLIINEHV